MDGEVGSLQYSLWGVGWVQDGPASTLSADRLSDRIIIYTVGSLRTLRLESLNHVFQPLHKFLVNKL